MKIIVPGRLDDSQSEQWILPTFVDGTFKLLLIKRRLIIDVNRSVSNTIMNRNGSQSASQHYEFLTNDNCPLMRELHLRHRKIPFEGCHFNTAYFVRVNDTDLTYMKIGRQLQNIIINHFDFTKEFQNPASYVAKIKISTRLVTGSVGGLYSFDGSHFIDCEPLKEINGMSISEFLKKDQDTIHNYFETKSLYNNIEILDQLLDGQASEALSVLRDRKLKLLV
jgi:hypothetical protein